MAIISSINGATRRVYLDSSGAVDNVLTFHPVVDVYANYKSLRASNDAYKPYNPFMEARGNEPKGSGKFTPRYLLLLEGTKLVIPSGVTRVEVTGEVLTDNQTDPFDYSLIVGPCTINYKPSEAEVIKVTASGNEYTLQQIANAVLDALVADHVIEGSVVDVLKKTMNSAKLASILSA